MRSSRSQVRHGLLIDIGSSSVGFAVVVSDPTQKQATTIWQKRDYVKVGSIDTVSEALKPILTTLTDMSLDVAQNGLKVLQQHTGTTASLHSMQVTVSAPWAYTVSRPISFKQAEPFAVTPELIKDLEVTASQQATEQFAADHPKIATELTETSRAVLETTANGYTLPAINNQKTDNLQIHHSVTLVNQTLQTALKELQDKLFPDTPLRITSGMIALFYASKNMHPETTDTCLVDITAEATEIGIVRNGSLTYSTHAAFGTNSLAREIAQTTKRPLSEVAARLSDFIQTEHTPDSHNILDSYRQQLQTLFQETGDSLAIPRAIHVLVAENAAAALVPHIQQAASQVSTTSPTITVIGDTFKKQSGNQDVTLATNASFFHTLPNLLHFHFV